MKCYFCKKETQKVFSISRKRDEKICGHCHSIHKLIRGSKIETVMAIVNRMNAKSCYGCKEFRWKRVDKCSHGNWTGIGSHYQTYPLSYAYAGCSYYVKSEDSI